MANPSPTEPKAVRLELRLDADLAQRVKEKAHLRGWSLGAVTRALLARWVHEDLISPAEVGQQTDRAPRKPRRKRAKKKAKS